MSKKKLGRFDLQKMKEEKRQAVWVTAYDYVTAQLAEEAGMDMLLVGDSLGMCVYGYNGTVPVTVDQSLLHTEAVRRGAPNTFVIGDLRLLKRNRQEKEDWRPATAPPYQRCSWVAQRDPISPWYRSGSFVWYHNNCHYLEN